MAVPRLPGRLLRDERGFTLVELVTALGMLLIVVTALTSVLVVATKAEEEMNRRFTSQINARIALDQLRREIHCASSVTGTYTSITVVLGTRCPSAGAGTTVMWCTSGSADRHALYRQVGLACDASAVKRVDYLTTGNVFGFPTPESGSLAKISVTLPVDAKPEAGLPDYQLADDIVLRNSTRT